MYQRVGSYDGKIPLQELAARLASFDLAWASDGHGTTTDHLIAVREAFRGDLAGWMPGEWAYSMLVALRPLGGNIPVHRDLPLREGLLRHHLVLQTNSHCWNFHGGDWQQLEMGGIYMVDPTIEHASINWGDTVRIHLVVDLVPPPAAAHPKHEGLVMAR
jgi:hypothetical protein